MHINLIVVDGPIGATEPVHVRRLSDDLFEVLFTPGLVEDVAAGDHIQLVEGPPGAFAVRYRGGNLAIKVMHPKSVEEPLCWVSPRLQSLGGRIDGQIAQGASITVPVTAGFAQVERLLNEAIEKYPGLVWYYSNVYAADGETTLDWWT